MKKMEKSGLNEYFGSRLQQDVPLSNLTTAKVGGSARHFITSNSAKQLAEDIHFLWSIEAPFFILGSGSNILISDEGIDAVVIHNKAKNIQIENPDTEPVLFAESGAVLISAARAAALQSLTGMEWATTVPGTVGGAVYGNAGAFGSSIQQRLLVADILHREQGILSLNSEQMGYSYRSSLLKRQPGEAIVLSARFRVEKGDNERIHGLMSEYSERRKLTQPLGPCMGSTFKNPEGDSAGRIIDSLGLKGTRVGGVSVSTLHANFFINDGSGSARDYFRLIQLVRGKVEEKTGIQLALEVELVGDWQDK